jgi:hypothetical protein
VEVTWQGLARCGGAPKPPTRAIRLFGNKGVLQTEGNGRVYLFVDHAGRSLRKLTQEPVTQQDLTWKHLSFMNS